jgi:hypothetical protein
MSIQASLAYKRHETSLTRPPELQNVVPIDAVTVQEALRLIVGCEACSEAAEISFDNILDRVTGSDPSVTDYVLEVPARCLQCGERINEMVDLS